MSNAVESKKDEPTDPRLIGMPLSAIMGAVLGAILGIGGTLFTTWWTAKESHLTKRVSEILPFQGSSGETGIMNLTLSSDGSKEAEEIEGRIRVDGSNIEDVKIAPDIIGADKSVKGDTITIKIKTLNAGETLQVAALVKKNASLPSKPVADFRGKGVVAEEKPSEGKSPNNSPYNTLVLIVGAFVGIMTIRILEPILEKAANLIGIQIRINK